mgnify:CR=1 FL=1
MRLPLLLLLLLLPTVRPLLGTWAWASAQDEASLIAELKAARDEADPARIAELAALRSRNALDGLLELYPLMDSVYMRREIVRALPAFDGVSEAEQAALQELADVATDSEDPELREAAIEGLGKCKHLGKSFLALIIDSPAQDEVREAAVRAHLGLADDGDFDWYKKLFQTKAVPQEEEGKEKQDKGKKKKEEEEAAAPERKKFNLDSLRELAFGQIAQRLTDEEVIEAKSDPAAPIRRAALEELHRRGWKGIEESARGVLDYIEDSPENRQAAAAILVRLNGPKEADAFIELGQKFATPDYLRRGLADLIAEMRDPATDKQVAKLLGKGKPYEKLFALLAARLNRERGVDKDLRKAVADKDPAVALTAVELLGVRADKEGVEELLAFAERAKDEKSLALVMDTIAMLIGEEASWDAKLDEWVTSSQTLVRNCALSQIAKRRGKAALDVLLTHLEHIDWSTRLAALNGLVLLREVSSLGPIIEQMSQEEGRILDEFADALWTLTGQPFRTRAASWQGWWEKEGANFQLISAAELEKLEAEEEARRLKQRYPVAFFGIRIISHRVIFVLDVSGSMAWDLRAEYKGQRPEPRIDVARRELKNCIDGLEEGALFNIITFSGDVSSWLDGGIAGSSGKTREEAKTYVDRLGAFGATNIYDALELAFEDPEVDTIYFLSDGEPTAGLIVDPHLIREDIQRRNEHRGIVIHTIAVGGTLQVLEWLAEDSGGTHVKFQ